MTPRLRRFATLVGMALFGAMASASAETLKVEIDHALLLRLDADADIIHIANPSIADVAMESPRMIFIVGLSEGQTGIYILDRDGNEMIVGSVLVTPSLQNEVTLNRNTTEYVFSCAPECAEVEVSGQDSAGGFDTGTGDSDDGSEF